MTTLHKTLATAVAVLLATALAASAATLSPALQEQLATLGDDEPAGMVIVAFDGGGPLGTSELLALQGVGITDAFTLSELKMAAAPVTVGQVRQLASTPGVRSVWSNDELDYHMDSARVLTGVDRVRTDPDFTFENGGLPVSGHGDFSVVVNDSGIDGTHADVEFPTHVVENVQILTDTDLLSGFTPLVTVKGVANTDTHIGHGTHVAGIVGGTGEHSGGLYEGVAPGARLIGTGSGVGLFILNALGGFEWSMANQFVYRIRVISNSWGSRGGFAPDDPINIATKKASDRNIVVLFSAGNSGPSTDTHNRYAKAPWVISVAAGTKEGGLVGFSSRGTPSWERLSDGDALNDFDAPTITAPGTGRQFASNSDRFTSDIVSVRASSNLVANGGDADLEIPEAFVPFYTQISGTSMSCPHVAGVVALMLEADPTLTPDEIKQILVQTATPMPGFLDYEAGAGYVNARAAVDVAFHRAKAYGAVADPDFNAGIDIAPVAAPEPFDIEFTYLDEEANLYPFQVASDVGILQVRIDFGNTVVTDEGNVFFLVLHAPDGEEIVVGPALPLLTPKHLEAVVRNPLPGDWAVEVSAGFLFGVAPATIPERVDGVIKRFSLDLEEVPDIFGHEAEATIRELLVSRRMDVFADGSFRPDDDVTREDLARTLALNVPLRQVLDEMPRFTDVTGDMRLFAESVSSDGSTLRDWNFDPAGIVPATGDTFDPVGLVDRLDAAVALVRALGEDAAAQALAGTTVTYQGDPLVDNDLIPAELRGYVQIALDIGLMEAFPAELREVEPGKFEAIPGPRFEPDTVVTRAGLAVVLNRFDELFAVDLAL